MSSRDRLLVVHEPPVVPVGVTHPRTHTNPISAGIQLEKCVDVIIAYLGEKLLGQACSLLI